MHRKQNVYTLWLSMVSPSGGASRCRAVQYATSSGDPSRWYAKSGLGMTCSALCVSLAEIVIHHHPPFTLLKTRSGAVHIKRVVSMQVTVNWLEDGHTASDLAWPASVRHHICQPASVDPLRHHHIYQPASVSQHIMANHLFIPQAFLLLTVLQAINWSWSLTTTLLHLCRPSTNSACRPSTLSSASSLFSVLSLPAPLQAINFILSIIPVFCSVPSRTSAGHQRTLRAGHQLCPQHHPCFLFCHFTHLCRAINCVFSIIPVFCSVSPCTSAGHQLRPQHHPCFLFCHFTHLGRPSTNSADHPLCPQHHPCFLFCQFTHLCRPSTASSASSLFSVLSLHAPLQAINCVLSVTILHHLCYFKHSCRPSTTSSVSLGMAALTKMMSGSHSTGT